MQRLAASVPAAAEGALEELAQAILQDAIAQTPKDTGALAASAYQRTVAPGVVRLGYTAPYAAAVHERLDIPHASGGAKFLERAIVEGHQHVAQGLTEAVRGAILAEAAPEDR